MVDNRSSVTPLKEADQEVALVHDVHGREELGEVVDRGGRVVPELLGQELVVGVDRHGRDVKSRDGVRDGEATGQGQDIARLVATHRTLPIVRRGRGIERVNPDLGERQPEGSVLGLGLALEGQPARVDAEQDRSPSPSTAPQKNTRGERGTSTRRSPSVAMMRAAGS